MVFLYLTSSKIKFFLINVKRFSDSKFILKPQFCSGIATSGYQLNLTESFILSTFKIFKLSRVILA